ncbi:hypothetical protein AU106_gp148 [Sinorhizobium phage phiM9]|uniref:Uncharacterized protein n=1 Tax=Sinorhizobium phage phiM9 TaxID=1636182 RepID=A0A0F6TH56_9CAUD|nr:hypothetical protein AU106_gp148 [Sinorhizobium phage phiM9]AKE44779.1 hypothetical protein Sm_phiM9_151 [Sinorhizobium phage phiM9]
MTDTGYGDLNYELKRGDFYTGSITDVNLDPIQSPMISFYSQGGTPFGQGDQVGSIKVDSDTRTLVFEGNIDESVKIFFESYWGQVMATYGLSISETHEAKCWNCKKPTELMDYWGFGNFKKRYECDDCGFCGPWVAAEVTG